jgi:multidrug transporter EmrE-like cation transporter
MLRTRFDPASLTHPISSFPTVAALLIGCTLFNIVANASFKAAAQSPNWRGFLSWQVVGNLAGFITVLTLTGLLRFIPLAIAFPVTTGLAVIGVQVAAAALIFHEPISPAQWLGTGVIIVGIFLVGRS